MKKFTAVLFIITFLFLIPHGIVFSQTKEATEGAVNETFKTDKKAILDKRYEAILLRYKDINTRIASRYEKILKTNKRASRMSQEISTVSKDLGSIEKSFQETVKVTVSNSNDENVWMVKMKQLNIQLKKYSQNLQKTINSLKSYELKPTITK